MFTCIVGFTLMLISGVLRISALNIQDNKAANSFSTCLYASIGSIAFVFIGWPTFSWLLIICAVYGILKDISRLF